MINAFIKIQATELYARLVPVDQYVSVRLPVGPAQSLGWFFPTCYHKPMIHFAQDIADLYRLCIAAMDGDGFVYVSSETADRLKRLTIEEYEALFQRYKKALVHYHDTRKKEIEEAAQAREEKDAHEAVLSALFIVFPVLIWLFS